MCALKIRRNIMETMFQFMDFKMKICVANKEQIIYPFHTIISIQPIF